MFKYKMLTIKKGFYHIITQRWMVILMCKNTGVAIANILLGSGAMDCKLQKILMLLMVLVLNWK